VIFDLDGTLLDTLDDITDSINILFAEYDYALVPEPQIRLMVGDGLALLLSRASGETDADRVDELVNRYRAVYRNLMFNRTRLYPGIGEMLTRLTRGGLPMCVLSNKSDEFTVPICEHYLTEWTFDMLRGARPDVPRKPDPTAALELCRRMECPPAHCVFVGDSDVDVQTAHHAGMQSVGVTWGYRDRDVIEDAGPTALLDNPHEVAAWILAS